MDTKSVSILYLSMGSGHQIAAESLADALRRRAPDIPIIVEDSLSTAMKFLPSFLGGVQAATNMLLPNMYDAAWRRGTVTETPIENLRWLQDVLLEELKRLDSGIIVATHVFPCLLANRLKLAGKLNDVKLFGVVTDYGLNPVWPIEGMDGYFVAHEELRQALIYRGVDPRVVHVTGIPIRPGFDRPRAANRSNRLRVLVMAGGIRNGGYLSIQERIARLALSLDGLDPSALEMTIVVGNQPRLEQSLKNLASKSRYKLDVRGFVNEMNELLAAHDILVTKPGGLIMAEALAAGIPMILSQPAPGVETANLEFLVRHGVALRGETASDIVHSLRACVEYPDPVGEMKFRAAALGLPRAADEASDLILNRVRERPAPGEYLPIPEYWTEITSAFRES